MGSRSRIATASCLVASALLVGGLGAATAHADPEATTRDDSAPSENRHTGKRDLPSRTGDGASDPGRPDGAPPGKDDPAPTPGGDDDAPGKAEDPVAEPEEPPRPPCCEEGDEDCWPWPWPWPDAPDVPPASEDDDDDRPPVGVPPNLPGAPAVGGPARPDVLDILPGVEIASTDVRTAPVSVPVLIPAPVGVGPVVGPAAVPAAGGGPAGGASAGVPAAPRQVGTSPPQVREPLPASVGSGAAAPVPGARIGYGEYLRSAGLAQIAALALPGVAGILVLTGAGGLLGYRQAKAGQGVRTSGIARFMK
ncbi:hypothetical protein PDG61_24630 [Mycolicibacterium sp. BiH015]|uniref:hypothetical protein n=1 Tax=Mycolicibacterium sp. BiH015 TaxID=3018808 RepID=UPI0022E4C12C|nr:hypothetical protein [Mycolicibacterium sp. BiH015]MDA2894117.1 hypothetical protein [Mycolicibacterium sp. BiH015]